jgi:hypothetical protein
MEGQSTISLEISEMVEGLQSGQFPDDNNLKVSRRTDILITWLVKRLWAYLVNFN